MSDVTVADGLRGHPEGLPYSMLAEGMRLGEAQFRVDGAEVASLVRNLADEEYSQRWPQTDAAPAAWGFLLVLRTMQEQGVVPPGCVFAGIEVDYLAPFRIGRMIRMESMVERLYERRGRSFAAIRYRAFDHESGEQLMCLDHILIWGG